MPRPKRNNKDVSVNPYVQQRNDRIEIINQKLDELKLPRMNSSWQNVQPSKRAKRTQQSSDAASEGQNLRRSARNHAENANEQFEEDPEYQPTENGNDQIGEEGLRNSPPKKRKARSITRMDNLFARTPSMPKIKITVNEYGQPIGEYYRQFCSVIGCLVRKTLSVGCPDWRLVDVKKKDQVWDALKEIYDVDEAAKDWVLVSAAKNGRNLRQP